MSDEKSGTFSERLRNLKRRFTKDDSSGASKDGQTDELLEAIADEELPQLSAADEDQQDVGEAETIEIEPIHEEVSATEDLAKQIEFYVGEVTETRNTLQQAFDRLGGQVEDLASTTKQLGASIGSMAQQGDQVKLLEEIRNQLDSMGLSNQQMIGALEAIPKAAREQAKALEVIENRLQDDGKKDKDLFQQLDRLGRGLIAMAKSNEAQQQVIKDTNDKLQAHLDLTEAQGNKLARNRTFTVVVLILLLIAAGIIASPIVMNWVGLASQTG